ncbi:hypothetical protein FALBO_10953 [Fusarium albosuccineum]|uniref:Uncharacterized protein n=1 Tax=Fusarium albosuccineum TaxID=1237068 RepID=A0A8H4L531_9HYPO|nr:hypothetical protein FALBO_10953 [Fusarium albosuccineum]
MPTHVLEGGLDSLSEEQIQKLGAARAAILEPAYDAYLISDGLLDKSPPLSSIQLLPTSDMTVNLIRPAEDNAATDLWISKISDPSADNFMGFSPEENCIAFKGERGLFDGFIEFAESVAQDKSVTIVFKTPKGIRIPREGLEYGLNYEDFAARVEVLECAMWIRTSQSHPQGQKNGTHPDIATVDSLVRGGMARSKSPSSDSSASLSPPPEIITTPPRLRTLCKRMRGSPDSDDESCFGSDHVKDEEAEVKKPKIKMNTRKSLRLSRR